MGKGIWWLHEKNSHRPNTKTTVFTACSGVFIGSIIDWWLKEFGCTYCSAITDLHSFCCNDTCIRMMVNTASGGWENCVVGEHIHVTIYFLITLQKLPIFFEGFTSWMRIWDVQMSDNSEFMILLRFVISESYSP